MHRVWKKVSKNHPGNFEKELKINIGFGVRTHLDDSLHDFDGVPLHHRFITNMR
jgi:hypothetical protein